MKKEPLNKFDKALLQKRLLYGLNANTNFKTHPQEYVHDLPLTPVRYDPSRP